MSAAGAPKPPRFPRAPRQLRFTREGRVFVLVTVGVGAAAVNTGNNLLFLVLGLMLSLIVLSGLLSEVALRRVRVSRSFPSRAVVGQTALVELTLHNQKKRAPSYSVEVEDLCDGAPWVRRGKVRAPGCFFLKVEAGQSVRQSYRWTPPRRGRIPFAGFRLSTRYPFGLFEKSRLLIADGEMVVFPMPQPAALSSDIFERGEAASIARVGQGAEVAGLRDYADHDEVRAVHWRKSAALGRLVVKEREQPLGRQLTVRVDPRGPAGAPESAQRTWNEAFEAEVSRAAYRVEAALAAGLAVEVVAGSRRLPLLPPGSSPAPALTFLALLCPVLDDAAVIARAPLTPADVAPAAAAEAVVDLTRRLPPSEPPGPPLRPSA